MARRALLVGINDYKGVSDLRGCHNDVGNMRNILKEYLGFSNNDIRVVIDSRATKEAILYRLEYMVSKARPGDFMVFHFSGHGSRIRDRNGDELEDGMDELLCPWDINWDNGFILDDDLNLIFSRIPQGALLEVFLDCCHSGTGLDLVSSSARSAASGNSSSSFQSRYLQPPPDIRYRFEGEEDQLCSTRGFTQGNRSGTRSTVNHILWAGCSADQESADANINGSYNGAFTYYFCKHMRETGGNISRRNLLERIKNSLKYNRLPQIPQLECTNPASYENNPLQYPCYDNAATRTLFLTTPYMRGEDVKNIQSALAKAGYRVTPDGVFGPHTFAIIKQYQKDNNLKIDGIAGPELYKRLVK
ncbi:Putative peptidoglycan binding domain-containing protein [Desulfonema limicola]|uniref:Peptidoglycan binding domain-containing protein n=1 Tax=Desulfonema limicola TaxID=45656 RepID=A0A975GIC3_9BACT|nr:caspase family protein [Desulfonema limicola]QTA82199.1 Putative peptidoglycan binding domain-containing protein [Desulfonema limicola]